MTLSKNIMALLTRLLTFLTIFSWEISACSFLFTTWHLNQSQLEQANTYMQRRGPDATNHVEKKGFTFVHNLLHMTGERVLQPFSYNDDQVQILFNGEIYNWAELEERYHRKKNKSGRRDDAGLFGGEGDVEGVWETAVDKQGEGGAFNDNGGFISETISGTTGSGEKINRVGFSSDGEAIFPAYREWGERFASVLDGEFAVVIVDFKKNFIYLSTDVFGTKPLWYSADRGFHAATYESALEKLGLQNRIQAPPNSILKFDLTTKLLISTRPNYEFDMRQYKTDTKDWIRSFLKAVEKRVRFQQHGVFLGLSSGFDSGAINLALSVLGKLHFAYTILAGEDVSILEKRLAQTQQHAEGNLVLFSEPLLIEEQSFLQNKTEPFYYKARDGQPVYVSGDFASAGLSWICRETRKRGILIYLSGSGADEYISDYGEKGEKIYPHSNFGGLFPEELEGIFPWHSFFLGTQRDYLMKEELIAGTHGVEGRYPFLDREVVQEYIWLSAELKNSKYKVVLDDWFKQEDYAKVAGKTGFNPHWNLRDEGEAVVHQVYSKEQERKDRWARESGSSGGGSGANSSGGNKNIKEGSSVREQILNDDSDQESNGNVMAQSTNRLSREATDFMLSPYFNPENQNQLITQKQCQEKLRVNFQMMCNVDEHVVDHPPLNEGALAEISSLEKARQDMAQLWAALQDEQDHLIRESERLHESATKEQKKFDLLKQEMIEQQHQQSVLMRAGTMHLLMMRLIRLEAAGDRAPQAITAGLHGRVSADVQVVTCVSGGSNLNVSDFPVFKIFVGSIVTQGVGVLNLCENLEWAGMPMRLKKYVEYLEDMAAEDANSEKPRLFLISDGMDVFFNDMTPVLEREGVSSLAELIRKRYTRFNKEIVVSSERLCGWGGAHLCTEKDAGNYPESPTTSKFLNAGGYIGPAKALLDMIQTVRGYVEECKNHPETRECGSGEGNPDQYMFMKYFWSHKETVGLDNYQSIFGNFIEVEKTACPDGWKPRCAIEPCCTRSDRIEAFSRIVHGLYETRGCSVYRRKERAEIEHVSGASDNEKVKGIPPPPSVDSYPPDAFDVYLNRTWQQQYLESKVSYGEDPLTSKPSLSSLALANGDEIIHTSYESLEIPFEEVPWNLPISWHGNGCGKWIFIMSLDALSWQCPVVAQLTAMLVRDQVMKDQEAMNKIESMQKRRWDDKR